jgi:hypothetical protein
MTQYDIAVAYRIYPVVSKPALGLPFSDDKLRLSEVCLRSFKESLGSLRAKIWVLLDQCPEVYAELFLRYFDSRDLVLLRLPGVGNQATFGKQIDILLNQTDANVVYFAEDDYVYLAGQFPQMVEFLQSYDDVDFVTPYDHLDCYTLEIHQRPKWVRIHSGHHWRTAASTCLTFLAKKDTLRRYQKNFRSYCDRNYDSSLWLSLTKYSIFNPFQALRFAINQRFFTKIIVKAWLYGWNQILFGRRAKLWVPVPGIATHLNAQALSPTIDWVSIMRNLDDPTTAPPQMRPIEDEVNQVSQYHGPRTLV